MGSNCCGTSEAETQKFHMDLCVFHLMGRGIVYGTWNIAVQNQTLRIFDILVSKFDALAYEMKWTMTIFFKHSDLCT